jgi:hypothetical protein
MEKKEFLDNNVEKIIETVNAILEKYPAHRSKEMEDVLEILDNALDSYIVEYGETLQGKQFGEKFETSRLPAYEDEENPVVVSSRAYYMQYNHVTEQNEQESSAIWWYYNKEGESDNTYSMSQHYFPSNTNVKQYIETGHIDFDLDSVEQILEKYALLLKESELGKLEGEAKNISAAEKLIDQKENEGQVID